MSNLILFQLDSRNATYVETTENGMWSSNWFNYTTANPPDFVLGPSGRYGSSAKLALGQLQYPADGIFPHDKFRCEFKIFSEGLDFTAQPAYSNFVEVTDNAESQGQGFQISKDSGDFLVWMWANEGTYPGGVNRSLQVRWTPPVGLFPSNTWVSGTVEYNGSQLFLYVGDVLKGSSPVSPIVPFLRYPISADPRGRGGQFHFTGSDGSVGGVDSPFSVADFDVYPNLRLSVAEASFTQRTATVDLDSVVDTWSPRNLAGVVAHYYQDAGGDGTDHSPTTRDPMLDLYQSAGEGSLGLIREALGWEVSIIPTMAGGPSGTITSIDFTNWHNYLDRLVDRGANIHVWCGYVPASLRTGGSYQTPPDSFTVYADYVSRIITDFKARYGVDRLAALSFWNEPEDTGFWNGTLTQFKNLWLAVAQRLLIDHPDVPLGTSDSGWGGLPYGGSSFGGDGYLTGVLDTAATNNLPCPPIHLHSYNSAIAQTEEGIRFYSEYAKNKATSVNPAVQNSWLTPKVRVTEWNYDLGYGGHESATTEWAGQQRRFGRVHNAAYQHAFYKRMSISGVDMATVFTMGALSGYENLAVVDDRAVTPIERPSFSLLRLMWKHGTSLLQTSVSPTDTVNLIASKDPATGRIMMTYSLYRPWRPNDSMTFGINWQNLPEHFTWTQYKLDASTEQLYTAVPSPGQFAGTGSLQVVAAGTETDLPFTVTSQALSLGGFEIIPTDFVPIQTSGSTESQTYSGVVIDQNQTPDLTDHVDISGGYYQEFVLPTNYLRGTDSDEQVYPPLSGFQLAVQIPSGLAAEASLTWVLQHDIFGSGWITDARGILTGAEADGDRVWLTAYFKDAIEIDQTLAGSRWRIFFQGDDSIGDAWVSIPNPLDSPNDVKAYQSNQSTPATLRGEEFSFMFRVLALTADDGIDFLGNSYRSAVLINDAANVSTAEGSDPNTFWMSGPNPSKFAVESLYFDLSDIGGNPVVVDKVLIDPITPDVYFNIYYTSEGDPALNPEDWDTKLWTHVPKSFKMTKRDSYALPDPIVARYIKLEFTQLQARSYAPGNFAQPVTYRKYPKWVLNYFVHRLANALPTNSSDRVSVVWDALDLGYNYMLDDLGQTPDQPVSTSDVASLVNFFSSLSDVSDQVDVTTLQKINLALQPYTFPPSGVADADSLLGRQAQALTGASTSSYPVELDISNLAAATDFSDVSVLRREQIVIDQMTPVMFFFLTCRHAYRVVTASFAHDRAYFAGVREVAFTRENYTAAHDTDLYITPSGDSTSHEINDFIWEDGIWVVNEP